MRYGKENILICSVGCSLSNLGHYANTEIWSLLCDIVNLLPNIKYQIS